MHDVVGPFAVVAHDAGAANLIFSWQAVSANSDLSPYMEGPARSLWQVKFPSIPLCHSLDHALQGANTLISGTGWASNLEHEARVRFGNRDVRSIAVLDHWVNFPERFERGGVKQLPDEIWVADEFARRIAIYEFPTVCIREFDNLYIRSQVEKVVPKVHTGSLLYVLEPIRQNWGQNQAGEFQALDFTLLNLHLISTTSISEIVLRPHPSESLSKYAHYQDRDTRIRIDRTSDMATALNSADFVVGVESFALVLALKAGRPVFSSLPPHAPAFRLPFEEIRQIRKC